MGLMDTLRAGKRLVRGDNVTAIMKRKENMLNNLAGKVMNRKVDAKHGIEMGIRPKDAMTMVAQSLKGAASLILNNDTHPSVEIDKVTTPGGITIKGINELEHNGFTSAVIKAMKASK